MTLPVLAIDGPAGTGKSTTAREAAARLGWPHLDSGAFYRVAALLALRGGLDLVRTDDRARLRNALAAATIETVDAEAGVRTRLDGEDVTAAIRGGEVTAVVSRVADDAELRTLVNAALRRRVGEGPAVVDGRDIGSVVFPDAAIKIYLDASPAVRARRRALQSEDPARAADPAVLARWEASLAARDEADRARPWGALAAAPDAIVIDTDDLDIEAQIARVVALARERTGRAGNR